MLIFAAKYKQLVALVKGCSVTYIILNVSICGDALVAFYSKLTHSDSRDITVVVH